MTQDNNQEKTQEINELEKSVEQTAVADATQEPAAPLTPEEKIIALEAQIQEHQDQFLRAKAEVENARRRSMEEVAKAHKFAIEGFARLEKSLIHTVTKLLLWCPMSKRLIRL